MQVFFTVRNYNLIVLSSLPCAEISNVKIKNQLANQIANLVPLWTSCLVKLLTSWQVKLLISWLVKLLTSCLVKLLTSWLVKLLTSLLVILLTSWLVKLLTSWLVKLLTSWLVKLLTCLLVIFLTWSHSESQWESSERFSRHKFSVCHVRPSVSVSTPHQCVIFCRLLLFINRES